jgi:hypothetical protein
MTQENAAMTALTAPKSAHQNRLEGYALTALLIGFPLYAGVVLCLKLVGVHEIVGDRFGAAIFVVIASFVHALIGPWLGRKFPSVIRNGYDPVFFDPNLSFSDKIAQWRMKPKVSIELVTNLLLLSLLAVGVTSIR